MTTATADPLLMMEEALRDLANCAKTVEAEHGTERKINKVILLEPLGSRVCAYRKVLEEIKRECQESIERFRKHFEIVLTQVQDMTRHMLHRVQGRTSGAGKSAAKKSTSASSGSGDGGGDGDGDGPQRTRSAPKKSRSSRPRNTLPQCPPRESPGETANPPPPPLPSSHLQGLKLLPLLYVIQCVFVVALLAMGEKEIACGVLSSGSLPALLECLKKKPDRKR